MRKLGYCLPVFLFLISACAASQQAEKKEAALPSFKELPRTVAILPFGNETDEVGISGQVRKSFSNHFSSKPYQKIEPYVVDEKVAQLEKSTGKTIFEIPPQDTAQALGVDGLIYGKVTDFKKVYAVAYSQMGIEAEVWMINTKTGQEVFRFKESVRYHEGGIPLSPIGLVIQAVSSAMNIREIQQVRVVNELGWKLNEKIPAPSGLKMEERPSIKEVVSNVKEGPFGKGKVFKIAMEGEKGLIAIFDIGGFKKGLPMKEIKDGQYLGEYLTLPGDTIKDAPVIAYLRRSTGEESSFVDITGLLTIDTTPPPQVAGLSGRAFIDRLELSWNKVSAGDLKGYHVLRSAKPISGYEDIGFAEEERFIDSNVKAGEAYYYRVAAEDSAKNEGEQSEAIKLSLRQKEPQILIGEIKKDRTLAAGSYMVKGEVIVAKGVVLTIEPDAKFLFEKDASIKVLGKIAANGKKEEWIEFSPKTPEDTWEGLVVDGGDANLSFVKASGAKTALKLINTPADIRNAIFEKSGVGIHAAGAPSPVIVKTTVWHNSTGVLLESSQSVVKESDITQNKAGFKIVKSSPSIKENNIFANDVNVDAEDISIQADNNFFGTVVYEEMRFKGDVKAAAVLDDKYPNGKIVKATVNPYSLLTPEEKKVKVAELLVSSGKYFRERNFGKSAAQFEDVLKLEESATTYYYLALSYQGMDDNEKALFYLKKGVEKFPLDSGLSKAYGLLLYQLGKDEEAKAAMKEAARLNPGDKQIRFILERLEGK
ncbi:MAG: DUF799 family lipoprotein [Deltaproteobacteria bacterium]|nr:DUF799 family lipoprotein [Deltaproteobacteria bacterium]